MGESAFGERGPVLHDLQSGRGPLGEFDYFPLNRVVFGAGSLAKLGELTRQEGGGRVLLVTDPGLEQTGHPVRAEKCLREAGLDVFVFDAVKENPSVSDVEAGCEAARAWQIDCLVAIGGGSTMDCAKGINFLFTNGGPLSRYVGFGKAALPMLPSIALPTTAGTGSEAQSYAIISDDVTHAKMACGDRKAAFRIAILDPELTLTQPKRVSAVTGIDALAHAIESMVSTRANALSRLHSRAAFERLSVNLPIVLNHPNDLDARAAVQFGAYLAGVAIENSMLGAAHACANPLTAHFGLTHGLAVSILLPHVIRFNASKCEPLFRDLCGGHCGEVASEMLARLVIDLMKQGGLPTSLHETKVPRTAFGLLAEEALAQWTGKFNPRRLDRSSVIGIYEQAMGEAGFPGS